MNDLIEALVLLYSFLAFLSGAGGLLFLYRRELRALVTRLLTLFLGLALLLTDLPEDH
ncbi:hypothetical protein GCM10027160_29410 [Streptomyces calidiresistens]|uniref:Uncharacterized protein n=1 Tax=Streptomyces calidiresistens TaxID=1485586 RepID=A0A7W3T1J2_9ACTN|nr:hypothetical protein [Streptomyces calidiresistens]MBB0229138.1 hypothetical protein [Streptomyces calidiresistens]